MRDATFGAWAGGRTRGARLLAFVLACAAAAGASAQDVSIRTERRGEALEIEGRARLAVPVAVAWAVLTDYEHLPRFIPGLVSSRVVSRDGRVLVLEQKGEVAVLFFAVPVEARLAIEETPYERITSRGLSGSFRSMQGRYDLRETEGAIEFRYTGSIVPDTWLPDFLGDGVLARHVDAQFRALVREISRRAAAGAG